MSGAMIPAKAGRLSSEEYLGQMMRHRFCAIAAGDDMSTHKIAEGWAVAARGGCLPLIVGNLNRPQPRYP